MSTESIIDAMEAKNKEPNNPHAFPCVVPGDEKKGWDAEVLEGMSLRDYFAAKAMQSLMTRTKFRSEDFKSVSEQSYHLADVMLKERENVQ